MKQNTMTANSIQQSRAPQLQTKEYDSPVFSLRRRSFLFQEKARAYAKR